MGNVVGKGFDCDKMIDFVCMEGEQMNIKINQLLEYALKME